MTGQRPKDLNCLSTKTSAASRRPAGLCRRSAAAARLPAMTHPTKPIATARIIIASTTSIMSIVQPLVTTTSTAKRPARAAIACIRAVLETLQAPRRCGDRRGSSGTRSTVPSLGVAARHPGSSGVSVSAIPRRRPRSRRSNALSAHVTVHGQHPWPALPDVRIAHGTPTRAPGPLAAVWNGAGHAAARGRPTARRSPSRPAGRR